MPDIGYLGSQASAHSGFDAHLHKKDNGHSMDIRPAATLVLTKDTADGLKVLLLQRTWEAVFMPGFFVFPGGSVD
ncbi:MAG: hypothetical protein R6U69_14755, partial [Marinobacter sp.]